MSLAFLYGCILTLFVCVITLSLYRHYIKMKFVENTFNKTILSCKLIDKYVSFSVHYTDTVWISGFCEVITMFDRVHPPLIKVRKEHCIEPIKVFESEHLAKVYCDMNGYKIVSETKLRSIHPFSEVIKEVEFKDGITTADAQLRWKEILNT